MVSSMELEKAELQTSLSPHRTLAQNELHGIGLVAESDSSSNSPHTGLRQMSMEGEGEGEDLVLRASKSSKGKAKKKKKKKKKSKTAELATEPSVVGVEPDTALERVTRVEPDGEGERREELTESVGADSPSQSGGREGEENAESAKRAHMSSPEGEEEEEEEMSYEQWASDKTGVGTLDREGTGPSRDQLELGEYEECDMGFGKEVTHPLPEAGNKRLSLADELEMANESEFATPGGDDQGGTPPSEPLSQRDNQEFATPTLHTEAIPIPAPSDQEREGTQYDNSPSGECWSSAVLVKRGCD